MCVFGPQVPDDLQEVVAAVVQSPCPQNVPPCQHHRLLIRRPCSQVRPSWYSETESLFQCVQLSCFHEEVCYLITALVFPCRPWRPRIGYGGIRLRWILGTLLGNPLLRDDPEEARENQGEPAGEDKLKLGVKISESLIPG